MAIKLDQYKTVNVRSTDEILDFLGDIGGFNDALVMIFATFGGFVGSGHAGSASYAERNWETNHGFDAMTKMLKSKMISALAMAVALRT